jgi:SAM-dependent methyltransferase
MRESLPDRRRQRYGDVDYDWEHRVDTTSAALGWRTRLLGLLHSPYQPVPPDLFHEIMASLSNNMDVREFTFVDIGSGKGRALLLASTYRFRRIIGIELLPQLSSIAQKNIRRFSERHPNLSSIEALCGDATEFSFPMSPLVVFLFHPLPRSGLKSVLSNLACSLAEHPRPACVIYANPIYQEMVPACLAFTKIAATHQYAVFRN